MLLVALLRFIHTNCAFSTYELEQQHANGNGGGWFIRELATESMDSEASKKENNPFYFSKFPGGKYDPSREDVYLETLQRFYSGDQRRLISRHRAKYWHSHLDRDRLLTYLDERISRSRQQDCVEIFQAHGFKVAAGKITELIADLLTQGLYNLAIGNPQINDVEWDPSLFKATKDSLAEEDNYKVRFSALKEGDIFVADGMLYIGHRKIHLPEYFVCDDDRKYLRRRFIIQACLAFSEDAGQTITAEEIIQAPKQYREDYADCIQSFHTAMSILALMQEVSVDGEEEFDRIKHDMFSSLRPVLRGRHGNAYDKLNATLAAATRSLLTKSHVSQTTGLFDNDARKGVCHSLADTGHLTWVTEATQPDWGS